MKPEHLVAEQTRRIVRMIGNSRDRTAGKIWEELMGFLSVHHDLIDSGRMDDHFIAIMRKWVELPADLTLEMAARAIVDIPDSVIRRNQELIQIAHTLACVVEGDAIGVFVHPNHVPMADRWGCPSSLLAKTAEGSKRIAWYAGCVAETSGSQIGLHVACPDKDPMKYKTYVIWVDAAEWRRQGHDPETANNTFVQVAIFTDKSLQIELVDNRPQEIGDYASHCVQALAYIHAWLTTKQ